MLPLGPNNKKIAKSGSKETKEKNKGHLNKVGTYNEIITKSWVYNVLLQSTQTAKKNNNTAGERFSNTGTGALMTSQKPFVSVPPHTPHPRKPRIQTSGTLVLRLLIVSVSPTTINRLFKLEQQ